MVEVGSFTPDAISKPTGITTVTSDRTQKVLILGTGRVSGPAVEYLGKNPKRQLIVVGAMETETKRVAPRAKWVKEIVLDVEGEQERMKSLIKEADVVLSLLPAGMHARVAKHCVGLGKSMVTSSYVSDEMRALDDIARTKGVTILNEVGLDPGMDHLSAMRIIDSAKKRGGVVTSFSSVCGGLPAPEHANNPFMYKFSWSPRAALSAAQQSATYLRDGTLCKIDGSRLLASAKPARVPWPTLR